MDTMAFIRTICVLNVFIFLCSGVYAGNSPRASSEDYLEYSLMGLKKSAKDTREQNKLLIKRIEEFKRETEALKQKLGAALQNKQQLALGYEQLRTHVGDHVEQLDLVKLKLLRLQKDAAQVSQEESRIQGLFQAKEAQDSQYQAKVSSLEREIVDIGEKIQELEYVINDDYGNQVKNYKQSIREADQKIKAVRKDLKQLEAEYGKPVQAVDALKRENDALKREIQAWADEQASLPVEEASPRGQAIAEDVAREAEPAQQVANLRQRKRELETILVKAKSKMDRATSLGAGGSGPAELEHNLLMIQAENQDLREQYSSLMQRAGSLPGM